MEKIKIKSNRKFFIKYFVILAIIMFVVVALLIIDILFIVTNHDELNKALILLYIFTPLEIVLIVFILLLKYKKGMSYIFSSEKIEVFKKDIFQYEIIVDEIITMSFYKFKWRY